MKKNLLYAFFMLFAASCSIDFSDLALPESVTLKGKPGIHIPIGYIADVGGEEANIANYVSDDKIREMAVRVEGVQVYSYNKPDSSVRTYLIHNPIVEMTLDLTEYMKTDITVPEITLANPNNTEQELPAVRIDLKDMAKLVKSVNGTASGIRIKTSDPVKEKLQIKIPALGINEYIPGRAGDEAGYLYFLGGAFNLKPQAEKAIFLHIKLTGACPKTAIAPEMVFNWTDAIVDTMDVPLEGDYPFDMGDLMGFLGDSTKFKKVKGYMYIDGINGGSMMLTLEDKDLLAGGPKPITAKTRPDFPPDPAMPFTETELPQHSITSMDWINLTPAFNEPGTGNKNLKYDIKMPEMHITKGNTKKKITADLVIEFPLEFTVSGESKNPFYQRDYVKLELKDVMPSLGKGGDLFGRTGNEDDILNGIDDVTIRMADCKNNIIGGVKWDPFTNKEITSKITIGVYVPATRYGGGITIADGETSKLTIRGEYPFNPELEILIPIDDDEAKTGTLQVLRSKQDETNRFDFFLEVEVTAKIEETINL